MYMIVYVRLVKVENITSHSRQFSHNYILTGNYLSMNQNAFDGSFTKSGLFLELV